jgi:hypothetical protein
MQGITINVGRGGLLADVGISPQPGTECRITFHDDTGRIAPRETSGRVVHVGMWTHRRTAVGVEFDTPLDKLELADAG